MAEKLAKDAREAELTNKVRAWFLQNDLDLYLRRVPLKKAAEKCSKDLGQRVPGWVFDSVKDRACKFYKVLPWRSFADRTLWIASEWEALRRWMECNGDMVRAVKDRVQLARLARADLAFVNPDMLAGSLWVEHYWKLHREGSADE